MIFSMKFEPVLHETHRKPGTAFCVHVLKYQRVCSAQVNCDQVLSCKILYSVNLRCPRTVCIANVVLSHFFPWKLMVVCQLHNYVLKNCLLSSAKAGKPHSNFALFKPFAPFIVIVQIQLALSKCTKIFTYLPTLKIFIVKCPMFWSSLTVIVLTLIIQRYFICAQQSTAKLILRGYKYSHSPIFHSLIFWTPRLYGCTRATVTQSYRSNALQRPKFLTLIREYLMNTLHTHVAQTIFAETVKRSVCWLCPCKTKLVNL